MKRMLKPRRDTINLEIRLNVYYSWSFDGVQASTELDLMNVDDMTCKIYNIPKGSPLDSRSSEFSMFMKFVDKVDELIERRGYDTLGESDGYYRGSDSAYRGVVFNFIQDLENGDHISGKVLNGLRLSGHKASRQSNRIKDTKLREVAISDEAKELNEGQPLAVGVLESIAVRCKVENQDKAIVENKEFYSYLDALKYVDLILDRWSDPHQYEHMWSE